MADDPPTVTVPPLHFGPYQTREELGRGGMGVVYKAVNEQGAIVAIKTVNARGANSHAAIRREIRSLRLVKHPGIVLVIADGMTDAGLPWIAMPFLQGPTLRHSIKGLWAQSALVESLAENQTTSTLADSVGPLPGAVLRQPLRLLVPVLTLIRRLCAPLAFLHGAGLVHRDLKPENVILREGGRPMLIDLGIAGYSGGTSGREELDIAPLAGSVHYIAPEQILGGPVDARADLYALGCILYECVTGRPPFLGQSNKMVLEQHLYAQPITPSHRTVGLPATLDELILKLLEKKPANRLGHASHVAARLDALGAQVEPDEDPRPRAYLYRSDLRGRAEDRTRIETTVHRLFRERCGGLVLVHGESGVGKTRLVMEVGPMAGRCEPAIPVLTGACMAIGDGGEGASLAIDSPLHPLLPLLRAAVDRAHPSRAETDRLFGPRGRILAPYEPALLDLPGQSEYPEPSPLPKGKARERVITAMLEVLWALAEPEPLLFVLDDLQRADDLTLGVLAAFTKAQPETRGVLLLATYRSEEVRSEIQDLARTSGVDTIALGRLEAWSISEIVAGMLATSNPPRAVLDALAGLANGNPFFVTQYLHAALEVGLLRWDESGRFCFDAPGAAEAITSLPLPRTVKDLITQRIERLNPEEQALAAWAAVLAQELDEELLGLNAQDGAAFTKALDTLAVRGILELSQEGRWRFAHDKLREIAYLRIDPTERATLHRRAGEALHVRFGKAKNKAAAIGHHFDQAGLHVKAARYYARAAAYAREAHTNADAIRFYEAAIAALRCMADVESARAEIAGLYERSGDVLELIGRHEDAWVSYGAALDECPAALPIERTRRIRKRGANRVLCRQFLHALPLYDDAEAALGEGPRSKAWWNEWLRIQMDRLSVHYRQGNIQGIALLDGVSEREVETWGTAKVRAHYFEARVLCNLRREGYVVSTDTLRFIRKSVTAARVARDAQDLLTIRCDLGIVLWLRGKLRKAEVQLIEVLDDAQRMGYREIQMRSSAYLMTILRRQRRLEETEKRAQDHLHLAEQQKLPDYVEFALANLAWVSLRRMNLVDAERKSREALMSWEKGQVALPFQWLARLPLCAVCLAQEDLAEAVVQAEAVLVPEQQRLPESLALALAQAVNAFKAGQQAQAKSALNKALNIAKKLGYA